MLRVVASSYQKDYLRVCGADPITCTVFLAKPGLPPRVRSRPCEPSGGIPAVGITSACAEQTFRSFFVPVRSEDYLRVCGADIFPALIALAAIGLPPRVRSRRRHAAWWSRCVWITSACAEQTGCTTGPSPPSRDYLRVCGADDGATRLVVPEGGLPPRVRSRRRHWRTTAPSKRITSACAEQTWTATTPSAAPVGLPPRVRSRHFERVLTSLLIGITSACAEQTSSDPCTTNPTTDYLRVCGADLVPLLAVPGEHGLPPRVRSRHRYLGAGASE